MPRRKKVITLKAPVVADVASPLAKFPAIKFLSPRYLVIFAAIVLIGLVLWRNKNWIIVASVNGQPITRWQLDSKLVSNYGSQTLDEMVNEALVRQAAAKKGVTVSSADVDSKISDIEKSLAGKISLQDALTQQGLTMSSFRQQVELQLLFEKMTADQTQVSAAEVADYISKNKDSLTATDEAGMNAEAKNAIQSQKNSDVFSKFFSDLKSQAKISKYL